MWKIVMGFRKVRFVVRVVLREIFMCDIPVVCVTNKEGGESQTTQLILCDVIFMKLHVSAISGQLQFSHQKEELQSVWGVGVEISTYYPLFTYAL
jgi:hypothetical protein